MTRAMILGALVGTMAGYLVVTNVALSQHISVNGPDATANAAPIELATTTNASYNWAGYVSESGQYTAVSATWVVPNASYPAHDGPIAADATWVGIGGVDARDLIQAGTQTLIDSDGNTQYQAWYETLPDVSQPIDLKVSPGDSVTIGIAYVGNNQWHISFTNNTTGKSAAANVSYASSFSSAEWIEEMPSLALGEGYRGSMPLDNFGRVNFTNASTVKDGSAVSVSESGATPLKMQNGVGSMLAAPSTISGVGDFSVVRGTASATPPRRVHVIIIGP